MDDTEKVYQRYMRTVRRFNLFEYNIEQPSHMDVSNPYSSSRTYMAISEPKVKLSMYERDWKRLVDLTILTDEYTMSPAEQDLWDKFVMLRRLSNG